MAEEKEIGKISHYFTNLGVAVIEVTNGELKNGDKIHIKGSTSDFEQTVDSLQIDRQEVEVVKKGESAGLKVVEHAREGDLVYLVE